MDAEAAARSERADGISYLCLPCLFGGAVALQVWQAFLENDVKALRLGAQSAMEGRPPDACGCFKAMPLSASELEKAGIEKLPAVLQPEDMRRLFGKGRERCVSPRSQDDPNGALAESVSLSGEGPTFHVLLDADGRRWPVRMPADLVADMLEAMLEPAPAPSPR